MFGAQTGSGRPNSTQPLTRSISVVLLWMWGAQGLGGSEAWPEPSPTLTSNAIPAPWGNRGGNDTSYPTTLPAILFTAATS